MDDLTRYLVDEFVEDYEQGRLTRRDALKLIAGIVGASVAAHRLDAHAQTPPAPLSSAAPPTASAYQVAPSDPSINASSVHFPGGGADLRGYLTKPARDGMFPIVLVCHEGRGLTRHIEDVTRRVAKAGYVGLAVDLLSREGGTDQNASDTIPALLAKAPPERHVKDFQFGLDAAKAQPFARKDRIGIVGFCFGGGVTWRVATGIPELRAAVPFYGPPLSADEVPKLKAAVLAIYAGRDERVNADIPAIESAMQKHGKTFRKIVYPDVEHAFHNDTGDRFNPAAARAAWDETLAWFGKYLQA
jgi:carboxymethylenebutenolidase